MTRPVAWDGSAAGHRDRRTHSHVPTDDFERAEGSDTPPLITDLASQGALAHPCHGPVRVAQELMLRGIQVSSGGVRGVWQRGHSGAYSRSGIGSAYWGSAEACVRSAAPEADQGAARDRRLAMVDTLSAQARDLYAMTDFATAYISTVVSMPNRESRGFRHDIVFPSASKRWILVGSGVR